MARPYSEYYDDPDATPAQRANHDPTLAGWYAFVCTMIGLGLNAIIGLLSFFIGSGHKDVVTPGWMIVTVYALDAVCFGLGLAGTILGMRSLSAHNPYYRGYGTTGLVLGIILILASLVVGFIFMCVGLVFVAANGGV